MFLKEGLKEIDEKVIPQMEAMFPSNTHPRCITSYAMLLWFTLQVSKHTCYEYLSYMHVPLYKLMKSAEIQDEKHLYQYFRESVVPTILKYQTSTAVAMERVNVNINDTVNNCVSKIIQCCKGLSKYQVNINFELHEIKITNDRFGPF